MRLSAEHILVTDAGGVVVGRGGDMCLFSKDEEQGEVEEKILSPQNTNVTTFNLFNIIMPAQLQHIFHQVQP